MDQKQTVWTVTIRFKIGAGERLHKIENLSSEGLMKLRNTLFSAGLMYLEDPGTWRIVPPFDVLEVMAYKQAAVYQRE